MKSTYVSHGLDKIITNVQAWAGYVIVLWVSPYAMQIQYATEIKV